MNLFKKLYWIFIIIFCFNIINFVNAEEPLHSFKDYLIIMVHGVNADHTTWVGQAEKEEKDRSNKLYEYLAKPVSGGGLNCTGNVFVYRFSDKCGYIPQNIQELGDPNYNNPANNSQTGDQFNIKENKCWIDQARWDYATRLFKEAPANKYQSVQDIIAHYSNLIPKKILFITHSMGNFAVRGYILSDELAARGAFDNVDNNWKDLSKKRTGFYKNDVDKVVFVDPTALGSETPTFVYFNFLLANMDLIKNIGGDFTKLVTGKFEKSGTAISVEQLENLWDSVGLILTAALVNELAGQPVSPEASLIAGAILQALCEYNTKLNGDQNIYDDIFKYIDRVGKYNSFEVSTKMYPDLLVESSKMLKTGFLQQGAKLFLAYVFEPNMRNKSIYGNDRKNKQNPFTDINNVKDSLNYQGMSDLLKDITLESINTNRGKDYKPVKYSFIVSDGSVETDAERVRDASNVYLGKIACDTVGLGGLNLGIPGQDVVSWAGDNPFLVSTLVDQKFWGLKRNISKLAALIFAHFGNVMTRAGDGVVSLESQRGEDIPEFANKKIYNQEFYPKKMEEFLSQTMPEEIAGIEASILIIETFVTHASLPPLLKGVMRTAPLFDLVGKTIGWRDELSEYWLPLVPHLRATAKPNLDVFTQALYEPPSIKIDGMYLELKGNEIEAYNLPTPSTLAQRVTLAPAPANNSEEGRAKWPNYVLVSTTNIPIPYGRAGGTPPQLIALQDTYYARITTFAYTEGASGSDTIQIYHPQENKVVWAANLAQQPSISSTIL